MSGSSLFPNIRRIRPLHRWSTEAPFIATSDVTQQVLCDITDRVWLFVPLRPQISLEDDYNTCTGVPLSIQRWYTGCFNEVMFHILLICSVLHNRNYCILQGIVGTFGAMFGLHPKQTLRETGRSVDLHSLTPQECACKVQEFACVVKSERSDSPNVHSWRVSPQVLSRGGGLNSLWDETSKILEYIRKFAQNDEEKSVAWQVQLTDKKWLERPGSTAPDRTPCEMPLSR